MSDEEKDTGIATYLKVAVLIIVLLLFGFAFRRANSALRSVDPPATIPAASGVGSSVKVTSNPASHLTNESSDVISTVVPPAQPTAAATSVPALTPLPLPEFSNPPLETFQKLATDWSAEFAVSDMGNTGVWQFEDNVLIHPIALEATSKVAYLIDSGHVLAIDLERADLPQSLLEPGDTIDSVLVLEPIDLALSGDQLFVLDRAGDVYRYEILQQTWHLDRYDRPVEASSGHYFMAIAAELLDGKSEPARALLEANYKFAQLYYGDETRIWRLSELRAVDLDTLEDNVFILQRAMHDQVGTITKYRDTSNISAFRPRLPIEDPRQVVATDDGVYVLDQGGRRLILFDSQYGALLRVVQLPQDQPISAIAAFEDSSDLLLTGKDRLYFFGDGGRLASIVGGAENGRFHSNDFQVLAHLDDFIVPVGGSNITFRDFQLPGAPRHYRLGVHRGLDFYWQLGTKVLATGDGTVIRADTDYVDPTAAELASWSEATRELGYTDDETLDAYLGRQIWIEHEPGIVSRYAHLRSIEPGLVPGAAVSRRQEIGEVGNSGSPASLESESSDAHLHFELWLDESYLGQYLRPIEARDWIERILPPNR